MRMLTTRQARALRSDSLSDIGNIYVRRLPEDQRTVYGPHRTRLRVGEGNTVPWPRVPRVVYRRRPPTCRDCGQRIEHGSKVVAFRFRSTGGWPDTMAFLHEECP